MRFCLLALMPLALSACEPGQKITSHQEVATPIKLSAKQLASVRAGVAKTLKDTDLQAINLGRVIAGRTSTTVVVCGYVSGKNSAGEQVSDRPFHGMFMGFDNASGFIVTGAGGEKDETAATLEVCRRSGLDLASS
jgi:hypothetical protein